MAQIPLRNSRHLQPPCAPRARRPSRPSAASTSPSCRPLARADREPATSSASPSARKRHPARPAGRRQNPLATSLAIPPPGDRRSTTAPCRTTSARWKRARRRPAGAKAGGADPPVTAAVDETGYLRPPTRALCSFSSSERRSSAPAQSLLEQGVEARGAVPRTSHAAAGDRPHPARLRPGQHPVNSYRLRDHSEWSQTLNAARHQLHRPAGTQTKAVTAA